MFSAYRIEGAPAGNGLGTYKANFTINFTGVNLTDVDDLREDGQLVGFVIDTEYNLGRVNKDSTAIHSDDVIMDGLCNAGQEIVYSNQLPMVFYNSDLVTFKRRLVFNVSVNNTYFM